MQIKKILSICVLGAGGLFALGCAPQLINEANSQTCDQVNEVSLRLVRNPRNAGAGGAR